jgi:glycosyltransferase involved in cell wall biosynthesis
MQGSVQAVIPAFNPPRGRVEAAVASCLAAPLVSRVLVVDDGSEPALALGGGDPRIELIRQNNAGPSGARNAGLERVLCTGPAAWVLLLDDDDLLESGTLGRAVEVGEGLDAAAVVSARYERSGEGGWRLKAVPEAWADRALPSPGEVFRPLAMFGASGVLVRRSVIEAGVRFDEGLQIGEDRDFLRRAAEVGPIAVSSAPLLTVTLHEEGLSSRRHLARRIRDHLVILDRYGQGDAAGPLCEQTRWLLNAMARQGTDGFDAAAWEQLAGAARERGWPVPIKSRLRAMARRLLSHAR